MNVVADTPVCSVCSRSTMEQFSRSQRKRWTQKRSAVCLRCQTNGPGQASTATAANETFVQNRMCLVLPQPYASLVVLGLYRCIPVRTVALKGYAGTLWIASHPKHARVDVTSEVSKIARFCQDLGETCDVVIPTRANLPLSCLVGSVEVQAGSMLSFQKMQRYSLMPYENSLPFAVPVHKPRKLIVPLPLDLSGAKKSVIVLKKANFESATLQSPCVSPPTVPSLQLRDDESGAGSNDEACRRGRAGALETRHSVYHARAPKPVDHTPHKLGPDHVILVWFRQDLRIRDNPALVAAAKTGARVVFVYIHPRDREEGGWPLGRAARVWLGHALRDLSSSLLEHYGSPLLLANAEHVDGGTEDVLRSIIAFFRASAVYFNRVYEPWKCAEDIRIQKSLSECGIYTRSFQAVVMYEPWEARCEENDSAMRLGFGSVGFFLRACEGVKVDTIPLKPPAGLRGYRFSEADIAAERPFHFDVEDLHLYQLPRRHAAHEDQAFGRQGCTFCLVKYGLFADTLCPHTRAGTVDWTVHMTEFWDMTEDGAFRAMNHFLEHGIQEFETRDKHRGDKVGTSMLSPYIRFGQLSARQVLFEVKCKHGASASRSYLRKFAWRDLSYWFLWRFPSVCDISFRPHYEHQSWTSDRTLLQKWQRGQTGFPLVDAAMRQLWCVGYMPNYLRHVVAGFLIEYLNIDWKQGFAWFHDTLVDADLAIQAFMWQNGGGCGTDSWNFVMHPVNAAKAADPDGEYVRKWVPELQALPSGLIHCPWEADLGTLCVANVRLGGTYYRRIVKDLEKAHEKNFRAVMKIREGIGKDCILPSGHEAIRLDNGRTAVCITRVDYREKKLCTFQTPEEKWDKRKRLAHGDTRGHAMKQEMLNYQRRQAESKFHVVA